MACICYEITNDLAKKKVKLTYRKNFSNLLSKLEENLHDSCNPDKMLLHNSDYRALSYTLPRNYLMPVIEEENANGKNKKNNNEDEEINFKSERLQKETSNLLKEEMTRKSALRFN